MSILANYVNNLFQASRNLLAEELFPEKDSVMNHIGLSFETEQINFKAFQQYQKASHNEYAPALFNLGRMYYYGSGTKENKETAIDLITQSATIGYDMAQNFLGILNSKGRGRDKEKAKLWFFKAHKDNRGAEYNLAFHLFSTASGNIPQLQQAMFHLRSAANRGHPYAKRSLHMLMAKYHRKKQKENEYKNKKESLEKKQLKEINNLKNMFNSILLKI